MAAPDLTAAQVMNLAAAHLNDVALSKYTYTVQIPYLNAALLELQEYYELNNMPVSDQTSAVINVPLAAAGIVEIGYSGVAGRILPSDLIEIKVLWESPEGLNQWTPVDRVDGLPLYDINSQISQFLVYQWATDKIKVLAANADNDLKIEYTRSLFTTVTASGDQLNIVNGLSYLSHKTAAFIAEDVEENDERAEKQHGQAELALDRAMGIGTKGRQRIVVRRRPFRAAFKRRRNY